MKSNATIYCICFSLFKYQVKCISQTWIKFPDNNQLCGYEPYELVTCDIRARRESNSQENKDSLISTDSVTTDCAGESRDINILLCPYVIFIFQSKIKNTTVNYNMFYVNGGSSLAGILFYYYLHVRIAF